MSGEMVVWTTQYRLHRRSGEPYKQLYFASSDNYAKARQKLGKIMRRLAGHRDWLYNGLDIIT